MRSIALKACVIATLVAPPASAQQRAFFVTTLGKDTLSFEQYERTAGAIVGDWVSLYGGIMFHHYVITLRPDGSVAQYQLTLHRVSGHVDGSVDIQLQGDSAVIRDNRGEEQRAAVGAVFPTFTNSMGPLDLIVSSARSMRADSSVIPTMSAFGPFRRGGMPVVFFGRDSVRFGNPLTPLYARVDAEGHILGMTARATTTRTETRRVATYDLRMTVAHFPNIPDSVRIAGAPSISPRDTVRATVGDAAITIDYGRPAARGRAVFSRGVLGDTLWRTGANAATQFVTTRDLIVGRDTLRAGSYSLWTSVSPDNSTYALVFNSQTGQWGTEHHAERDVLRVPLGTERTKAPIERFTIRLPSDSRGSTLRLEWATTGLTLAVTALPALKAQTAPPRPNVAGVWTMDTTKFAKHDAELAALRLSVTARGDTLVIVTDVQDVGRPPYTSTSRYVPERELKPAAATDTVRLNGLTWAGDTLILRSTMTRPDRTLNMEERWAVDETGHTLSRLQTVLDGTRRSQQTLVFTRP